MATSENNAATEYLLGDSPADGAGNVRTRKPRKADNGSGQDQSQVAVSEAGDDSRVEMDQSDFGDAATWNEDHRLRRRLLIAQADVKRLEKDVDVPKTQMKNGKFYGGFKGISAAQVVYAAKQILTQNGIFYSSASHMDWIKREDNKTLVYVQATFENVDNPDDSITKGSWGEGNDNSDRGVQKATTNAEKIILSKMLLMTIAGEDEAEPVPTKEKGDTEERRKLDEEAEVNIQQWAGAYKAALEGCTSLEQLEKVRKDNKAIMKSDRVPDVTREFFVDLIASLEGQLTNEQPDSQ